MQIVVLLTQLRELLALQMASIFAFLCVLSLLAFQTMMFLGSGSHYQN